MEPILPDLSVYVTEEEEWDLSMACRLALPRMSLDDVAVIVARWPPDRTTETLLALLENPELSVAAIPSMEPAAAANEGEALLALLASTFSKGPAPGDDMAFLERFPTSELAPFVWARAMRAERDPGARRLMLATALDSGVPAVSEEVAVIAACDPALGQLLDAGELSRVARLLDPADPAPIVSLAGTLAHRGELDMAHERLVAALTNMSKLHVCRETDVEVDFDEEGTEYTRVPDVVTCSILLNRVAALRRRLGWGPLPGLRYEDDDLVRGALGVCQESACGTVRRLRLDGDQPFEGPKGGDVRFVQCVDDALLRTGPHVMTPKVYVEVSGRSGCVGGVKGRLIRPRSERPN